MSPASVPVLILAQSVSWPLTSPGASRVTSFQPLAPSWTGFCSAPPLPWVARAVAARIVGIADKSALRVADQVDVGRILEHAGCCVVHPPG